MPCGELFSLPLPIWEIPPEKRDQTQECNSPRQGTVGLKAHGDKGALHRQAESFGASLFPDGDFGQGLVAGEFKNL